MSVITQPVELDAGVESVLCRIASQPGAFALESTSPHHRGGRWTILGFDPVDVVETENADSPDWLNVLQHRIGPGDSRYRTEVVPFAGGWVGHIDYEAGAALERVQTTKPRDVRVSSVRFALYDTVALFDYDRNGWTIAAVDIPSYRKNRESAAHRIKCIENMLHTASTPQPIDWSRLISDDPKPAMSRNDYFHRVADAKRLIADGDIYQVNLTQRFTTRCEAPALDLYRRLRVANPAAYSAFLTGDHCAVLSVSPELFLDLRDRCIVTRPIKGTRPRTGDRVLDAVRANELLASEKDAAELNMIVDLLRNDLGRVAESGSVRVESPGQLESHPTVFHRTATIAARLRDDRNWADLLRAALPGGSITGCPKIRAMRIITELESTRRSVYCGCIGFIGLDGSMCLNIAIRTMILDRDRLHLFGGGAITADSRAQDEYDESLAKIAGLKRALRGRHPSVGAADGVMERSA